MLLIGYCKMIKKQINEKCQCITRNIKIGQKVLNINRLTLNKRSSEMRDWCLKCPTFHIAIRYPLLRKK